MYTVNINAIIPLEFTNVDASSEFEATEKVKNLFLETMPIIILDNQEKIKQQMFFNILNIEK